jgi:serine/threonine protein kinase
MGSARPDQLHLPIASPSPHSRPASYFSSSEHSHSSASFSDDDDIVEESVFFDEYGQRIVIREPPKPRPRRRREREREREVEEPVVVNLDYYQHPEKRWEGRKARYNRAHDIYSLGCVLLELGLWGTLEVLVEVEDDDFERVRRGFQSLTMRLDGFVSRLPSSSPLAITCSLLFLYLGFRVIIRGLC